MLQVEKLNQYYGAAHTLRGVSLNVEKGQCVALLGALYLLGVSGGDGDEQEPPASVATASPEPKKSSSAKRRKQRAAAKPMRVSIVATGEVYVCMEDSRGRAIVDKETLEAGQRTRTFRGRRAGTQVARHPHSGAQPAQRDSGACARAR